MPNKIKKYEELSTEEKKNLAAKEHDESNTKYEIDNNGFKVE